MRWLPFTEKMRVLRFAKKKQRWLPFAEKMRDGYPAPRSQRLYVRSMI
jgi:hypothetical protein